MSTDNAQLTARVLKWHVPGTDAYEVATLADHLSARLAEVEAERDEAIARERDVWARINTYNDDPVTRLKALALLDGEYEAMEAQLEAWRPVVEAAREIVASGDMPTTLMWVRLAAAVDALPPTPPTGGTDA